MRRYLVLMVILFLSPILHAEDGFKITNINTAGTRAILKHKNQLQERDTLAATDEFAEECYGEVVQVNGEKAVVDISDCENAKSLKVGTEFVKSSKPTPTYEKKQVSSSSGPTIDEDWYTLWGLGFGRVKYGDDEVERSFDNAEDQAGVDRSTITTDLFGFYWPLADRKSMQGFVVSGTSDSLSGPGGDVTVSQYTYSYSFHKFFGRNIGDGWFLRGDLGLAVYSVDIDTIILKDSYTSDFGFGALAGGGYGIALGTQTRLLIGGYYAFRHAEDADASTVSLNFGFLF